MLVKLYGNDRESEARYSPAECIGRKMAAISGNPNPEHISTSYVERQNLNKHLMNPNLSHPSMRFDLLKGTLRAN
jgi:hypothetical protein